jgi:hypothetical protein
MVNSSVLLVACVLALGAAVAVVEAKPPHIDGVFVGPELNRKHEGNWTFEFRTRFGTKDVIVTAPHKDAHFNATYHTADGENKEKNIIDFRMVDPPALKGKISLGIYKLMTDTKAGTDLQIAVVRSVLPSPACLCFALRCLFVWFLGLFFIPAVSLCAQSYADFLPPPARSRSLASPRALAPPVSAQACPGCTHRPHDYGPSHMNRVFLLARK